MEAACVEHFARCMLHDAHDSCKHCTSDEQQRDRSPGEVSTLGGTRSDGPPPCTEATGGVNLPRITRTPSTPCIVPHTDILTHHHLNGLDRARGHVQYLFLGTARPNVAGSVYLPGGDDPPRHPALRSLATAHPEVEQSRHAALHLLLLLDTLGLR